MNGLSCGEESVTKCSAVLIQYQRVTDGRTDVQPISLACFSIADTRKNHSSRSMHVADRCWQQQEYITDPTNTTSSTESMEAQEKTNLHAKKVRNMLASVSVTSLENPRSELYC